MNPQNSFRLGVLILLGCISLSLAQQQQMPQCAVSCLQTSLQAQSECTPTDIACICTNGPLNNALQMCVGQSCTVRETLVALNVTNTMCERPIRDRTKISSVLCGITGSLAIIAVILRMINTWQCENFAMDDACALLAGLFVIPENAATFATGPAGFGKDIWTVPFDKITYILKMIFLMQNFYWPISALTKLAFLFFYLRIFPSYTLRKYIQATMALTLCYWTGYQLGNLFYCRPITMIWNGWDGEHKGHCIDINKFMVSACFINIAIDIIIILLPIRELLKLRLSWRKKIGLLAMFLVGGFTLIISIIRVQSILQYHKSQNATYDNVPAGYWSVMEVNIGVFCVCMPAMRRILGNHLPRIFGTTSGSRATPTTPGIDKQQPRGRKGTFGGSLLYDTAIKKTVTTNVSILNKDGHDDEIELVDTRPKEHYLEMQSQSEAHSQTNGSRDTSVSQR